MIRLLQLLCPERHCVIAALYDAGRGGTFEQARQGLEERMQVLKMDPYCGICGSPSLAWEDRATKFPDMKKAMEVCKVCEADNIATRKHLDQTGQSFKSKQNN